MSDSTVWFGFLEAGDKSSPVARDDRLDTGNPQTVYLYNLQRRQFLEYKRAIVEPKLRDLKRAESSALDELKAAFEEAVRSFTPRGTQSGVVAERGRRAPSPAKARESAAEYDLVSAGDEVDEPEGWEEADED